MSFLGSEFTTWKEFSKRGVEISLPKTGNHAQLFATSGMDYSATKDQVTTYISKLMVQFLIEYEDNNGNFCEYTRDKYFHAKISNHKFNRVRIFLIRTTSGRF